MMSVAAGAGPCTALTDGGDVTERRALWEETPSMEFMDRGFSDEAPRRLLLDNAVKADSCDVCGCGGGGGGLAEDRAGMRGATRVAIVFCGKVMPVGAETRVKAAQHLV